jgi:hypothetical protein
MLDFRLLLTPLSKDGSCIHSLAVDISFETSDLQTGNILVTLGTTCGNVPNQNYDSNTISAQDENGEIPLERQIADSDDGQVQNWLIGRPVTGRVSVRALATPRKLEDVHYSGPRCDMLPEKDGLQASGCSFIPLPPVLIQSCEEYTITTEWDLSELSSDNKRAIWTFGWECGA